MSLISIRPYFRERLTTLGFTEWAEPFDAENIPSTMVDMAYHWQMGDVSGQTRSNLDQELEADVEIKLFFKGFRDPSSALDEVIKKAETVVKDLLKSDNWGDASPPIAAVLLRGMSFEPFDDAQNDNLIMARLNFVARVFVCIE